MIAGAGGAPQARPMRIANDGSGVFAFNCGGPAFQINKERLETDIGPRLVNMVRNVEAALNGH